MNPSTSYLAGQKLVQFTRRVITSPITKPLRDFVQGFKDATKEQK